MNKNNEYYFIDLNVITMKIVNWGISNTATLTGETGDQHVHRIFLTKGQYNKAVKYLK
jgi:hypothetical protein